VERLHVAADAHSRAANCLVRATSVTNYPNCVLLADELSELFHAVAANSSSRVAASAHSWVAVASLLFEVVASWDVVLQSALRAP
jgi:hypothetical protein